jgi:hypothetical protein
MKTKYFNIIFCFLLFTAGIQVVLSQTEIEKSMFKNEKTYFNPEAVPLIINPKDSLLYDTFPSIIHFRDFIYSNDSNQAMHTSKRLRLNL